MKIKLFFLIICLLSKNLWALEVEAKYVVLIDAKTKSILYEKNAYETMAPSSMSKMMTSYVIFDYLKKGKMKLSDEITHSEKAWRTEGSRMFVPVRAQITIDDLLKGLIIQSGNDAAVSLAEAASGTEEDFAHVMNEYAKMLGLKNTHFVNSTGLPNDNQYSTAYDLAIIADRTISDFPEYYPYYAMLDFKYNNIKQYNRNTLLYSYAGADGLKTGHTDAAGYGITFSAVKNNKRIIGVINGLDSVKKRSITAEQLLNYGFMNFSNIIFAKKSTPVQQIEVLYGSEKKVSVVSKEDIIFTVANTNKNKIQAKIEFDTPLVAPIQEGDEIAKIIIVDHSTGISKTYPLVASNSILRINFLSRMIKNITYYMSKK